MSFLLARRGRALLAAAAGVVALGTATPAALAFGPVDQQQPLQDGSLALPPGIAQTFTVGRDGRFDGFTLTATASGQIAFQIYDLRADGTPDVNKPRLPQNGSAALLAGVPANVGVTAFPVKAGDRLALAVGTIRSYATISLATGSGDPYPQGDLFQVSGAFAFTALSGVDLTFSTHVTSPAATQLALSPLSSTGGRATAVLGFGSPTQPLAGKVVSFALLRSTGAVKDTCSATTGSTGVATCSKRWSIPTGGKVTASFAGDADYLPSSAATTS